jgi:hypothetical protein
VNGLRDSTKVALALLVSLILNVGLVHGWSNGGFSTDPTHPKYGTHDWIAQHALDWLPTQEKQYIQDNLATYLYGTELPDNGQAPDGIGDTSKHHVYFSATGEATDDASARRAETEYNIALTYLKAQNYSDAAKTAGTITHYIADMGVFGHVMGSSTPWGSEKHHSDYEDYVEARTTSYSSSFNSYLTFDGSLSNISAYNAAINLAYDTTFGGSSHLTCVWMDNNYNWNNPTFANRCGESLNLAVNAVTDMLHTLYQQAASSSTATPTATPSSSALPSPTPTYSSSSTPKASPSANPTVNPTPTVPELPFGTIIALVITATTCTACLLNHKRPPK